MQLLFSKVDSSNYYFDLFVLWVVGFPYFKIFFARDILQQEYAMTMLLFPFVFRSDYLVLNIIVLKAVFVFCISH